MGKRISRVITKGEKFGRLLVLDIYKKDGLYWTKCQCDCGKIKEVRKNSLLSGGTTSCGCFFREQLNEKVGRLVEFDGVKKYAKEWTKDPRCTVDYYTVMQRLHRGWSDHDAFFTPRCGKNTNKTERMKSKSKKIIAFGEEKTLDEWIVDKRCKVNKSLLMIRLRRGMSPEKAISAEKRFDAKKYEMFGEEKFFSEWLKDPRCYMKKSTVKARLKKGYSLEESISKSLPRRFINFEETFIIEGEKKTLREWYLDNRCAVDNKCFLQRLHLGWDVVRAFKTGKFLRNRRKQ